MKLAEAIHNRKLEFKLQPYVRGESGRRDGEDEYGFGEEIKTDLTVVWKEGIVTCRYRVYCSCISDNAVSSQWIKMGGDKFYL